MAFRLSMLLGADASQAKAALGETRGAVEATKKSARDLGQEGRRAAQGVNSLGRAADGAEAQMHGLAEAEQRAAMQAQGLSRHGQLAAGSMGNLVAQFNDIGMMMMAGQNPLQLAVQQGTQITQVIGPLGAAGAVRALGSAFVAMLNPVNMITIGVIAAGAAMTQWLFSAKGDAEDLEDVLQRIDESIDTINENADLRSLSGIEEMRKRYGAVTAELRSLAEAREALAQAEADDGIGAAVAKLQDTRAPSWGQWATNFVLTEQHEAIRLARDLEIPLEAARELRDEMQTLSAADGAGERNASLQRMRDLILEASDGYAGLNENARDLVGSITDMEDAQARVTAASNRSAAANREFVASLGGELLSSAQQYLNVRLREHKAAEDMLSTLNQRAQIATLVAQYGADSLQVAEAQVAAERAVVVEQIEALDVSESMKQELLTALDAALGIESSNMAATIAAGADEAERLAKNLGISLAAATSLSNLQSSRTYSGRGGDPRDFEDGGKSADYESRLGYTPIDKLIEQFNRQSSRGGRGKSATDREREAVARLIEREREQLAVLRETDPVQKELIRNRQILAAATEEERKILEDSIRTRIEEREEMKKSKDQVDEWRRGIYEALEGAALRGESLADVFSNIVAPALFKAAILGEGPLGNLFGGQGLLGLVFPALGKADGGYITGDGGARQDKVPIMGSAGEFMVNARATTRYRHLLEHINSGGDVPGYATGGLIGAAPGAGMVGAGPAGREQRPEQVEIYLAEGLRARLLGEARQQSMVLIREFSRTQLPGRVEAITNDPGARG